jgi:UPF0755 protein
VTTNGAGGRRRSATIIVVSLMALVILCVGAVAVVFIAGRDSRLNPVEALILRARLAAANEALNQPASTDGTPVCFPINAGDTAATIAARLGAQGVVRDVDLFGAYLRYFGLDSNLQVATYSLRRNLTIPEVAKLLSEPDASIFTLRIIEGWRAEEIAALLDRTPGLTFRGADFLALVGGNASRTADVQAFVARVGLPVGRSLEGFLYPATYTFPTCASAQEVVSYLLTTFDAYVGSQLRADITARSLTLYQVVTIASIIEREAVVEAERPIIGSVYWNRYLNSLSTAPNPNIPVTLDADPTIQYVLGNTRTAGTWWPRLTVADYRGVISPYNTYLNRGLPPGPIANPRLSSIQAAAYPAQTSYSYFRASCAGDGTHKFAVTFQEQLANACN